MTAPIQSKDNYVPDLVNRIEDALVEGPPLKVMGQNWALTVVLGPEGCHQRNVKFVQVFLGTFDTEEECDEHAQKLWNRGYKWFDMHKVPMYKCLPYPPCTKVEKVKYVDEEMQSIMQGYKKQEEYAQRALHDRVMFDREEERKAIAAREAEQTGNQEIEEKKCV